MDVLTPEQRRRCMRAIKRRDTSPELLLRKALHAEGFRYVLGSVLPGHPDLVFPARRVVIFVDGCFWHGCPQHATMPKTNERAWKEKIEANQVRDRRSNLFLENLGWKVLRVWEHDIKRALPDTVNRVCTVLRAKGGKA